MDALYCHPMDFTSSLFLPVIVQATLSSLALELENPLTAVLHFLRDFLGYAAGRVPSKMESAIPPEMQAAIQEIIHVYGHDFCTRIISGMIFTFPRDCVVDGAGALMTLIEIDARTSVDWIQHALQTLPEENMSHAEAKRFLEHLEKYIH
jgi:transportin-3